MFSHVDSAYSKISGVSDLWKQTRGFFVFRKERLRYLGKVEESFLKLRIYGTKGYSTKQVLRYLAIYENKYLRE